MSIGTRNMCVKFPENQTNTVGGVAIWKTFDDITQTDRQTDRQTEIQTDTSITYTVSSSSCKPADGGAENKRQLRRGVGRKFGENIAGTESSSKARDRYRIREGVVPPSTGSLEFRSGKLEILDTKS